MMCDSQGQASHLDPITMAIRGNALSFPAPHWSPDSSADLRMVGGLLSDPVTRAIRQDALGFQEPAWPEGHSALVFVGGKLSGALTAPTAA